jgi:hypothetical protein
MSDSFQFKVLGATPVPSNLLERCKEIRKSAEANLLDVGIGNTLVLGVARSILKSRRTHFSPGVDRVLQLQDRLRRLLRGEVRSVAPVNGGRVKAWVDTIV